MDVSLLFLYSNGMQKTLTITVERMTHDGAGEGTSEVGPVRVFGMLPGEVGIVDAHKKHGIFVGVLRELIKSSPSRKNPEELHFLSCSPWQVMDYPLQLSLKLDLLTSLFGFYDDAPKPTIVPADKFYGYRTKVEFSFTDRDGDVPRPLALAFHERGGGSRRLALESGCALISDSMNSVALEICKRLRELGYTSRDLKTLVVRESKSSGAMIAILFAKKEEIARFDVSDIKGLTGFIVFHSTEKSPASVPTKELWREGSDTLTEDILGAPITYSWDSFFQNNIPLFAKALTAMKAVISKDANVLELYSGVGTIGLLLTDKAKRVHGVEIVEGAVESAKKNAERMGVTNYVAECIPAEKMDARLLDGREVLVLDPPRSGLHPKVIGMILEKQPKQIIYLSCNPETQARDYSALAALYSIASITGYDFYPETPHVESLVILNLRAI